MGKAIGYVRLFHQEPEADRFRLDEQRDRITAWCEEAGYKVEAIYYDEDHDWRNFGRPGFRHALENVREGMALVIVSLDRATRSAIQVVQLFERLHDGGVHLVSLDEGLNTASDSGRMSVCLLETLSRFNREEPTTPSPKVPAPPQQPDPAPPVQRTPAPGTRGTTETNSGPDLNVPQTGGFSDPTFKLFQDMRPKRQKERRRISRSGGPGGKKRRSSDYIAVSQESTRFLQRGQYKKALALWKPFLEVAEENNMGMALNTIGDIYVKMNQPIEAIDYLFQASRAFEAAGYYPKAVAAIKKVLKLNPRQMEVHLQLAHLASRCDRVGDAVESYLQFARHLMAQGLRNEALNVFEKIRILDPVNTRHRLQLAQELLEFGFPNEAVCETCYVADLLAAQGNKRDAKRHLTRIRQSVPDHPDIAATLARIDQPEPATELPDHGELVLEDSPAVRSSESEWLRPLDSDVA